LCIVFPSSSYDGVLNNPVFSAVLRRLGYLRRNPDLIVKLRGKRLVADKIIQQLFRKINFMLNTPSFYLLQNEIRRSRF